MRTLLAVLAGLFAIGILAWIAQILDSEFSDDWDDEKRRELNYSVDELTRRERAQKALMVLVFALGFLRF